MRWPSTIAPMFHSGTLETASIVNGRLTVWFLIAGTEISSEVLGGKDRSIEKVGHEGFPVREVPAELSLMPGSSTLFKSRYPDIDSQS